MELKLRRFYFYPSATGSGGIFREGKIARDLPRELRCELRYTGLIIAAATGAGLMYLFDPDTGKRRRALLRDQVEHTRRSAADPGPARDIVNRTRGAFAELRYRFNGTNVDDTVLEERVRSRAGRAVRYASSIEVDVSNGQVTLRGPVLRKDLERLFKSVSSVPGVKGVDDQHLEVFEQPGSIPGLQGDTSPPPPGRLWSPATRALAGVGGTALALYGLSRGGLLGIGLAVGGGALAVRGITNMSVQRLTGFGAGRRAVDFHKTLTIDVPVERVFQLWSQYESFPRFMSNVREVSERGFNRSHWIVGGPLGLPVEWDAVITRFEPNELLAWKTVEGSAIKHAGIARFEPTEDGATRVDIRLSYNPIAGAAGHAVAALFHSDPKKQMDDDLMRMKTHIETGQPPNDAAARERARAGKSRGSDPSEVGETPTAAELRDQAAEEEIKASIANPDEA